MRLMVSIRCCQLSKCRPEFLSERSPSANLEPRMLRCLRLRFSQTTVPNYERSYASFGLNRKRKFARRSWIEVDSFVCGDYSFMMWNMNAGMPTTMQTTLRTTPRVEY